MPEHHPTETQTPETQTPRGTADERELPDSPGRARGGGRATHRIPFGRLALEFVVIVVGVLVALGVDQWMTTIDHRRLVNETLYALAAEIAENTVTLDRRIAYHDRILPGLAENQRAAEGGERRRISISGALPEGLGLTTLRSTAWELASVTEAVRHFDLPILSTLSLTYALQESLHEYDRIVSAGIIQPQFFAATDQPAPIIYLGVMVSDVSGAGRRAEAILRRDASACASAAGRSRGWRGDGGPLMGAGLFP